MLWRKYGGLYSCPLGMSKECSGCESCDQNKRSLKAWKCECIQKRQVYNYEDLRTPEVTNLAGKGILVIVLEVPSSKDLWNKTNITYCGFGHGKITDFSSESPIIQKRKKILLNIR